tara:strand:- start:2859 stop:3041 length:183 start_codon:yes stop_codon:yes gene_type:complete
MTNSYNKTELRVLEEGLAAMSKANQMLITQNQTLTDQVIELDAQVKLLKHKLLVNLETPE